MTPQKQSIYEFGFEQIQYERYRKNSIVFFQENLNK